jgi:hypothetical protein
MHPSIVNSVGEEGKGVKSMSDDAQEARHFFEVVALVCLLFFGIPLGIVSLRIAEGLLSGPVGAVGY